MGRQKPFLQQQGGVGSSCLSFHCQYLTTALLMSGIMATKPLLFLRLVTWPALFTSFWSHSNHDGQWWKFFLWTLWNKLLRETFSGSWVWWYVPGILVSTSWGRKTTIVRPSAQLENTQSQNKKTRWYSSGIWGFRFNHTHKHTHVGTHTHTNTNQSIWENAHHCVNMWW